MIHRTIVLLLLSLIPLAAREPLDRPNVVVILLDDSGSGDFTHNGNPVIETPVTSLLAAEGVSFKQFHVTSPACSASRYSLMSGRYPERSSFGGETRDNHGRGLNQMESGGNNPQKSLQNKGFRGILTVAKGGSKHEKAEMCARWVREKGSPPAEKISRARKRDF